MQGEVQLTRWRSAAVRYWHNRPDLRTAAAIDGPIEGADHDERDSMRSFEPTVEPMTGG